MKYAKGGIKTGELNNIAEGLFDPGQVGKANVITSENVNEVMKRFKKLLNRNNQLNALFI